jgi:hypothetical protein
MHIPDEAQAILTEMEIAGFAFQRITFSSDGYTVEVATHEAPYYAGDEYFGATDATALAACREVERQWRARKGTP